MKKFLAMLLALSLTLCLMTACGGKKKDSIEGEWVLKVPIAKFMEEGMGIKGMAKKMDCDAAFEITYEFDEEEVTMSTDKDQIQEAYEEFAEAFSDFLKEDEDGKEAFLEAIEQDEDQLMAALEAEGMDWDDYCDMMAEQLKEQDTSVAVKKKTQEYEFDGEVIKMEDDKEYEVDLDGDEMEIISISEDGEEVDEALEKIMQGLVMERQ